MRYDCERLLVFNPTENLIVRFRNNVLKENDIEEKTVVVQQEMQRLPYEPEMVFVEGGTFIMGCTREQMDNCRKDEQPAHRVTLNSFYIAKYEVTQEQWIKIMGKNPSDMSENCSDCPVNTISWNDIVGTSGNFMELKGIKYYENGFIYNLNQQSCKNYRLPTEAEWEYAARGGNQSKGYMYSGGDYADELAWNLRTADINFNISPFPFHEPHRVGTKKPNELGIYDMSGNVWECCSDWKGEYSSETQANPTGPLSGRLRVKRGGGYTDITSCRVSYRSIVSPKKRSEDLGLRLVLSIQQD